MAFAMLDRNDVISHCLLEEVEEAATGAAVGGTAVDTGVSTGARVVVVGVAGAAVVVVVVVAGAGIAVVTVEFTEGGATLCSTNSIAGSRLSVTAKRSRTATTITGVRSILRLAEKQRSRNRFEPPMVHQARPHVGVCATVFHSATRTS